MSEVTPRDREEKLLAAIAEGATGELPTPRNRKEKLLKEIYDNGGTGGGGEVPIDDENESETSVWSSKKTSDEIAKVDTEVKESIEELSDNLGEKVDYKVVVEDGNRYVEDVVTQDINAWLPNDNSSILINLKKSNGTNYLNFQLLCNKKDSKNWSCIVNGAANELWKIRYIDGVRYIDELATMDKVPESVVNPTELDTNKFLKSGYYSLGDASNRTNLPAVEACTLLVFNAGYYIIQEIFTNVSNGMYYRKSLNNGNTWSAWTKVSTT